MSKVVIVTPEGRILDTSKPAPGTPAQEVCTYTPVSIEQITREAAAQAARQSTVVTKELTKGE